MKCDGRAERSARPPVSPVGYCVEQVEEIMRTDATCRCWLPVDMLELPDAAVPLADVPLAELPLAVVLPPAVDPAVPLPPAAPEPLGEPLAPAPVEPGEPDEADVSEPVTST